MERVFEPFFTTRPKGKGLRARPGHRLLLTDVIMPHMLGKELATKLHDRCPDIRVLYMSGYAQPVLASQGTLDPGVVLVEKPFSEDALLDRVRAVLNPA